ncbi:uncharacterized protein MELLADRAFT_66775 [Melampsora larici-populina 98AG31]|uniref:Uncharacterized protein n=1 Tax=Melampsora larici-populina (strain 98AG31 / pathotype 3-4-7) TaxID=747676 RepID=F4S0I6_MELLP|nr:uncharacterized protein MELLADRAFT_66775 [Melampsora larici-populina 98AG31]EGG01862.1 hypothetical protein MELLADRAFT_66775 [Melampsora larici-populina 98AG31]
MGLGTLRMKKPIGTDEKMNEKKPNKRSRRQTTRSPSIDPTLPPYGYRKDESIDIYPSGSSTASRRAFEESKAKGKGKATDSEIGIGEELVINWTTSSEEMANRLLSIPLQNHREFQHRLKDALRDEEEIRFERLLEEDQYLPKRWKSNEFGKHQVKDLDKTTLSRMEGEDYDEYIRKRMWSRSHRTEYLNAKEKEEKQRKEEVKRKLKREEEKIKSKEKMKNRMEKESKRKEMKMKSYKESYETKWNLINSLQTLKHDDDQSQSINPNLSFDQIPWPIFLEEESEDLFKTNLQIDLINRFTITSIKEFLFKDIEDFNLKKKIIRSSLLLYHPDRFDSLILQRIQSHGSEKEKEKEKVKQIGLRVSQILNEIHQEL